MKELYTLPALPYAYEALEPHISREIMILHHDKHHAAYVSGLEAALKKHPDLFLKSPQELLVRINDVPEDIRLAVRNHGGGHVNHSLFWSIMSPDGGGQPAGALAEAINKHFGSFEQFKEAFNEAGTKHFGSGWVWLVQNPDGALQILTTQNQDNPLTNGQKPIMGNDVWEHAYYLQYKNVRADYLKAWWNVVNWKEVEKFF